MLIKQSNKGTKDLKRRVAELEEEKESVVL
jgi:hypothetical protein